LDFTHAALFVVKAHFVRQHVKADDGRGADAFPIGGKGGDIDAMAAWEPWSTIAAMRVSGAFRLTSGLDQPDACKSCFDPGTLLLISQ
jgi:hypothetical protein